MSHRQDAADDHADGPDDEEWLSIEAACKILGVDQSTLRRWSDSGRVPVFRTPGGHRRYRAKDLQALVQGEVRPRRRMSRRVLTDMSISAYETQYLQQARSRPWYRAYGPAQREELRHLGRKLVDLAVSTISGRGNRTQLFDEGRTIGRRYGAISAEMGLSVTDAIEAFLFFRYPVIQAVSQFIEEENLPTKRAVRAFHEISQFMDEVLVSTVAAHSDCQS